MGDESNLDPERVEKAKALSAGPLGQQDAKHPLLFAWALLFGEPPDGGTEPAINSATATIVGLDGGPIAITCWHVIDAYLRRREVSPNLLLQLGTSTIDIDRDLLAHDADLDLATIALTQVRDLDFRADGTPGSTMHRPVRWPPHSVSSGDFVTLGGYPGAWRRNVGPGTYEFGTFSVGTTPVVSVHSDRIAVQFDRAFWIQSFDYESRNELAFKQLGGLSGAPVVIWRGLHYELVGYVYEFSETFDIVFVRPAGLIDGDGSVRRP